MKKFLNPALKLCVGRTIPFTSIVILNEAQRSEEPPCTNTGVSTRGFLVTLGMTIIIYLLSASYSFAQQSKIDSLLTILKTAKEDTTRIKTLNALAWKLKYNKPDTAILLSTQALELCEKTLPLFLGGDARRAEGVKKATAQSHRSLGVFNTIKGNYPLALIHYNKALKINEQLNDKKGIASTFGNIGIVYERQGDYPKALEYYFKALKMDEELGNKRGIAIRLGNIGIVYRNQGDNPKALEYYFKALKANEEIGRKKGIAINLGNIGNVYADQNDYPKALEYYFKGLKMDEELGRKSGIAANLGNIGNVYERQGDYPKALEYYFKALKMDEELGNKRGIAVDLGNIGTIYYDQGDYPKALEYYFKALKMRQELGAKKLIASTLGNIGSLYTTQKKYPEAERYLLQALEVSTGIGALSIIKDHHEMLTELYEQTRQYQKTYEHYKAYSIAKNTLYNEEKSKEIGKLEAGFEYDKKLALEQAEHEKQAAVAASESVRQRVVIYAVCSGMGLLIVFFILLFNRFRVIRRQKEVIAAKNKDITDSIRYAENIQKAILPPIEEIKKALPESFILFKPKDIVSGDFYFYAKVGSTVVIAACDCTGHGVPGAFMSMIGNSLLNEIVNDKSITNAAEVLNQLKDGIIHAFGEAGVTGEQKDGMDMALCTFKTSEVSKTSEVCTLQYAGAYNPLYIVRNGKTSDKTSQVSETCEVCELEQIKADKQPVGFHFGKQKPFTNHEIQLKKSDTIYIFSDGYQDQFGGPKGKKFMSKRFRQLFLDIQEMNMEEQKEHLDKTIEEWKGSKEQVDDILVIGVRV